MVASHGPPPPSYGSRSLRRPLTSAAALSLGAVSGILRRWGYGPAWGNRRLDCRVISCLGWVALGTTNSRGEMSPTDIHDELGKRVIGQQEALRYVSVAIFKHLQGEKYGNLLLIGNSGTGKTTIMRGIEALYAAYEELAEYRVVLIMNANTLATEDGAVDPGRLFSRLEERVRQVLGSGATAEEIGRLMERATICLDEIDKVSGLMGGKPYVTGINIQQAVLTLIEGERVPYRITAPAGKDGGTMQSSTVWVDTGKMLF